MPSVHRSSGGGDGNGDGDGDTEQMTIEAGRHEIYNDFTLLLRRHRCLSSTRPIDVAHRKNEIITAATAPPRIRPGNDDKWKNDAFERRQMKISKFKL